MPSLLDHKIGWRRVEIEFLEESSRVGASPFEAGFSR